MFIKTLEVWIETFKRSLFQKTYNGKLSESLERFELKSSQNLMNLMKMRIQQRSLICKKRFMKLARSFDQKISLTLIQQNNLQINLLNL